MECYSALFKDSIKSLITFQSFKNTSTTIQHVTKHHMKEVGLQA